jgi:hypothetical protein
MVGYHFSYALSQSSSRYWFSDYWFSSLPFVGLSIPWILISMFAVQLLTLVLGLASIRFDRRDLLLPPFLLSSTVAVLMTYTGERISGDVEAISGQYQVGYYLVYPSIAMFLFALLLNEVTKSGARVRAETEASGLSHS